MEKVRIDKYLWSIRIFKTRSLATEACDSGRVKCNGNNVKPAKAVNIGEVYSVKAEGRDWVIEVVGLLEQRKAYAEAINFYKDITPVEEINKREKMTASFFTGKRLSKTGKPTKKERRDRDDFLDKDLIE